MVLQGLGGSRRIHGVASQTLCRRRRCLAWIICTPRGRHKIPSVRCRCRDRGWSTQRGGGAMRMEATCQPRMAMAVTLSIGHRIEAPTSPPHRSTHEPATSKHPRAGCRRRGCGAFPIRRRYGLLGDCFASPSERQNEMPSMALGVCTAGALCAPRAASAQLRGTLMNLQRNIRNSLAAHQCYLARVWPQNPYYSGSRTLNLNTVKLCPRISR